MDTKSPVWEDWFAYYPVEIDAYDESERGKNGEFKYKIWGRWVKRSYQTIITSDPGDIEETWTGWKYRL